MADQPNPLADLWDEVGEEPAEPESTYAQDAPYRCTQCEAPAYGRRGLHQAVWDKEAQTYVIERKITCIKGHVTFQAEPLPKPRRNRVKRRGFY